MLIYLNYNILILLSLFNYFQHHVVITFFTLSNSTSFYNSWNPLSNNFNVLSFDPAALYNSIEFIWLATLSSFPCIINNGYVKL